MFATMAEAQMTNDAGNKAVGQKERIHDDWLRTPVWTFRTWAALPAKQRRNTTT